MARVVFYVISILIFVVDTIAGIFGIKAEMAQNQGKHLEVLYMECREPVQLAYQLGLSAAVLMASVHAIANLVGGCTCICSSTNLQPFSLSRQISSIFLVLSWVVLSIGCATLIIGALPNSKPATTCGLVRPHFLYIGGILCFVHGQFCLTYYVLANEATQEQGRDAQMSSRVTPVVENQHLPIEN